MLYKSIVPTNSKLKYVIVTNTKVTTSCDSSVSVYLFNDRFFFIVKLSYLLLKYNPKSNDIYIGNQCNSILYDSKLRYSSLLFNKLNDLFYTWDSYYCNKLVIDGKAYRITKFIKNNFKLMFGRSHMVILLTRGVFLRKKKKIKKKFMFYGVNKNIVKMCSLLSRSIRPNDMFTDRGIRFSKQINNRKLGKKGSSSVL